MAHPKASKCEFQDDSGQLLEQENADQMVGLFTLIVSAMAGIVSFSSSVQTPAISAIADAYGSSHLLLTFAASSAYLLGFGTGPFLFSPLSELLGRKKVYLGAFLVFTLMQLGCALSPNVVTLAVFRFIAGFTGGPTVANAGGSITDCGPVLGPILGGPLTEYASWRWNFWIVLMLSGVTYFVMLIFLPETYHAGSLSEAKGKASENTILSDLAHDFGRPWRMLATEPILLALSTLMAFIYGVLFLDFSAYPIVFIQRRGWSTASSGLAFLGIGLGMLVATALSPLLDRQYAKLVLATPSKRVEPEIRLRHLILISWLLPPSLFWFAWTALPPIHWIVPILSGIPFGFSLVLLFLGINAYLTDCYAHYSASALAANTMLRSLFGASFALFATQLYDGLGTPWATSLLGFIAVALAPMPFLLLKFGPWLRSRSQFHLSTIAT